MIWVNNTNGNIVKWQLVVTNCKNTNDKKIVEKNSN